MILFQAGILVWGVFLGAPADPKHPPHGHDPRFGFWFPPALPALLSLLIGITPIEPAALASFLADSAKAAYGAKVKVSLALWTGINVPLILSIAAVSLGLLLVLAEKPPAPGADGLPAQPDRERALRCYPARGLEWGAREATRLQRGQIRFYIGVMLTTAFAMVLWFGGLPLNFLTAADVFSPPASNGVVVVLRVLALLIAVGAALVSVVHAGATCTPFLAFGVSGLGVAAWMGVGTRPRMWRWCRWWWIFSPRLSLVITAHHHRALRKKAQEFTGMRRRAPACCVTP